MSRRFKVRGVVATEELEDLRASAAAADDADTDPVDEVEDHAESAESEVVEAQDAEADADAERADAEESEEVAEVMESMIDVLRASAGGIGLDAAGAQLYQIGLESLCLRVGIDEVNHVSLEDFNGASSRVRGTVVSMEEAEGKLKQIWESTVATIKRFWEMLKQLWMKLTASAERFAARAKQLGEVATKMIGKGEPKAKEFPSGLGKELHIGGSVDPIAAVKTLATVLAKVKSAQDAAIAIAAKAKSNGNFVEAHQESISNFTGKLTSAIGEDEAQKLYKAKSAARSAELPGGKAIVFLVTSNEGEGKFTIADHSASTFEAKTLPTLDPKTVQNLCAGVAKVCEGLASLNEERKKAESEIPGLLDALKKVFEKNEASEDERRARKALISIARDYLAEPSKSYASYAVRACGTLLHYAELSLKQYGGAPAEEKKPEGEAAAA